MLGVEPTLVTPTCVLIKDISKAQVVKEVGGGEAKEDLPIRGCPDLASDSDGFRQNSTSQDTKLQLTTATFASLSPLVKPALRLRDFSQEPYEYPLTTKNQDSTIRTLWYCMVSTF